MDVDCVLVRTHSHGHGTRRGILFDRIHFEFGTGKRNHHFKKSIIHHEEEEEDVTVESSSKADDSSATRQQIVSKSKKTKMYIWNMN